MDIFGNNIDCCDDETGGGGQPIIADTITNSTGDNTIDLTSPNIDLQTTGNVLINGTPINQGGGDVSGPVSSVDGNIATYNGISGKLIKNSAVNIDNAGILVAPDVEAIGTLTVGAINVGENITELQQKTQHQTSNPTETIFDSNINVGTTLRLSSTGSSIIGSQTPMTITTTAPSGIITLASSLSVNVLNADFNIQGGTATTEKLTFTDPQELVSKLYVDEQNPFDTAIANIEPLNELVNTYGSPSVCLGVRKLVSTYTGNCFEVIDPASITGTSVIGFDANGIADYTAFIALAAPVYINIWYDQSGNGYDFTGELATVAKPSLIFTTVNGRNNPSVVFNGSKFSYSDQLDLGLQNASHTSIFSMKSNSTAIQFLSGSGVDAQNNEILVNNVGVGLTVFDDSYAPPTEVANIGANGDYTDGNWHTILGGSNINFATCRADLLTDGVASVAGTQDTATLVHYLGIRNFNSSLPFDGEMSEFVVFPTNWIANDTVYENFHTNLTEFHTLGYNNAISAEFKPIKNIIDPQDPQDAATKAYVDSKTTPLETKTQYQSAGGNVTTFVSQIHSGTVRPLVDNLYDCGIPSSRWKKIWTNDIDTGNVSTSNITANTLTENIAVNKISNVGGNVAEIIAANKVVNAAASILTTSNLHQFAGKMTSDRTLAQITDPADITTKAYVDGTTFQTIHDALALPLSNPVEIAYVAPTTNREFLITSTSAEQILKATDTTGVEINNLSITSGNIQLSDIAEPTNALDGQGKLYKKTGNDALFWKADSTGAEVNVLTGVGTPPTATASQITNFNDYSVLTPAQMLSSLTLAGGGVNKCYGNSVRMTADVDILAGRVVSLSDYATNITGLRVGYLQTSSETNPVVYPVGITLNNALAGQKVDVCTQGLCTGIMSNATTLNRGSVVACTGSTGLVVAGSAISANVGVLGSVAMGGVILANQPVLLYLQPWYSVF